MRFVTSFPCCNFGFPCFPSLYHNSKMYGVLFPSNIQRTVFARKPKSYRLPIIEVVPKKVKMIAVKLPQSLGNLSKRA